MQQLLAFVFAACTLIVDRQGRHFQRHQLPDEAGRAMVQACAESNPFPSDPDGRLCVATTMVQGALESAWSLHPGGSNDHGHAAGPYQEWRGGELRTASWLSATRHYLETVRQAMRVCPEQFWAPVAGERCGSSSVHVERMRQVTTLLGTP